jgi:hypothetical protein
LIWDGGGLFGSENSHNFFVCPYQGSDHLCLYTGNLLLGYGQGNALIIDDSYRIVHSIHPGNGQTGADMHEFNFVENNKSVLLSIYENLPYDLTSYNISSGLAFLQAGGFQKVDVETGAVSFDWRSIDYIDPSESVVLPSSTDASGDGKLPTTAWQYFHINSVDMDSNGDYLVSARHTSAIYKISGKNGSVIWTLGGKNSSFQLQNFNFSFQHDARFISENDGTTVISLFDNASNGYTNSSSKSGGMVVSLDTQNMTASLLNSYQAPDGTILSDSQGNMQFLPNGNAFIGWGSNPAVSEFLPDGTPIYFASFSTGKAMHYRAYKFNFTSNPTSSPSIYSYAQNSTAPTTLYVSWNGATEVGSWQFYGGSSAQNLSFLGSANKTGFETVTTYPSFNQVVIAEAVGKNGTALRNSTVISTYTPGSVLAPFCNQLQCPLASGVDLTPQLVPMSNDIIAIQQPAQSPSSSGSGPSATGGSTDPSSTSQGGSCSSSFGVRVEVKAWFGALFALASAYLLL